jgi:dihydrofolate reductase
MTISLIVAAADNGVIGGKDGGLPWHQGTDIRRFREITSGHPVIMGRRTADELDGPLPGRLNIIVTRHAGYKADGFKVTDSLESALQLAAKEDQDEIFVIGGSQIFELALPLADKIYLTEVHGEPEGVAFFRFDKTGWHEADRQDFPADKDNDFAYSFVTWLRD